VKHDPIIGEYIEVTLEDIAVATDLAHQLFGLSIDDLSPPSRNLLGLIADFVKQSGVAWNEFEFSRRQLREAIVWSDARLRSHLDELLRMEYLVSMCGRVGSTFRYRMVIDPDHIAADRPCLPGLKSIEQLRQEVANLAGQKANLAGIYPNLAATSQVPTCEVAEGLTPCGSNDNGHANPNLAGKSGEHIYEIGPKKLARRYTNGAAKGSAHGAVR
jgi:hypothetical protein